MPTNNNNLNIYHYWSFVILFFGFLFFTMGLYFLGLDFILMIDWEVFSLNSSSFVMSFLLDWMSLIFLGSVLFISSMVILYSDSYMTADLFKSRFLYLVLLFILSMLLLIISPNLVSILLGWDGLGLVSYCLVIYFQNTSSYNAGMLTLLTNRIGDALILISISWMFNLGSWNYVFYTGYLSVSSSWMMYLLILASFTKSAQIPFSSWLPAAMAAPTPVSALVHSSTLVTAGVYLLIRFSDTLFLLSLNKLVILLSCLTMFMAGIGANFEYDLKSVIALSTLSQLGFMMAILFLGYSSLSFFHLLSHAFFKALLFLCAGLIIHGMGDTQDIRHMGGLINQIPYTCACFCISSLSLCGLPFLSGFYSKDLILDYASFFSYNILVYVIFFLSVGLTVAYSLRLIWFCMFGNSGLFPIMNYTEDPFMTASMLFLVLMSIMCGSALNWLIFSSPDPAPLPLICKLAPLMFIMAGAYLGYETSLMSLGESICGVTSPLPLVFLGSMWFMPNFSTYLLYSNSLNPINNLWFSLDSGWGEYLISNSLSNYIYFISSSAEVYNYNNIKIYLLSFIMMMVFILLAF